LKERDYAVVHVNPLAETIEGKFSVTEELKEPTNEISTYLLKDTSKLIEKAIELLYTTIRRNIRKKIALLVDDAFQTIELDKAETLVKSLLNMIEYPSIKYENIVILVASSEGITRERIGRHRWADLFIMWNMPKEGFKQLYNILPNPKPSFDDIWRLTGGNPETLEKLYKTNWNVESIIDSIIRSKRLKAFIASLNNKEKEALKETLQDPDMILEKLREPETQQLERKLIELNLIIEVWDRNEWSWIDTPPPEKDLEFGIGKYYAWQTPIHKEAVKRTLDQAEKKT